jgi:redox-regulated HSP33 family molecular chaperone
MSKDKSHELTDEILESMREEVNAFFATHEQIPSSIEYEEKVLEIARKFAASLIGGGVGELPKDRNAKKKS